MTELLEHMFLVQELCELDVYGTVVYHHFRFSGFQVYELCFMDWVYKVSLCIV